MSKHIIDHARKDLPQIMHVLFQALLFLLSKDVITVIEVISDYCSMSIGVVCSCNKENELNIARWTSCSGGR
jgi:hypothetical protein